MAAIVGVVAAKEVSICRNGANQHSHVLITKNMGPTPAPAPAAKAEAAQTETEDMDIAVAKALLAMNDVTKAHFLALEDDAAKVFLAKSAADQTAEAEAAKKLVDAEAEKTKTAADLAEAAKTDMSKRLEQTEKTNADLVAEIATMKQDKELEKVAADPELAGYPGGVDAVKSVLRSIAKVDEATRTSVIDGMKAKAKLATAATNEYGGRTAEDMEKGAPKQAEFERAVVKHMADNPGVDRTKAMLAVSNDPAHKAAYSAAIAEAGLA